MSSFAQRLCGALAVLLAILCLSLLASPAALSQELVLERTDGVDELPAPILFIGTGETFRVRLSEQPTANVVLTIYADVFQDEINLNISPATMVFGRDDWSVSQLVSVSLVSYDNPAFPTDDDFIEIYIEEHPTLNEAEEYGGVFEFIEGQLILLQSGFGHVSDVGYVPDVTEGLEQTISIYAIGSTRDVTFTFSSEGSSDNLRAPAQEVVLGRGNETGSFVVEVTDDDYVNRVPPEFAESLLLPYTLLLSVSSNDDNFNGDVTVSGIFNDNDDDSALFSVSSETATIPEGGDITLTVSLNSGLYPGSGDLELGAAIRFGSQELYSFSPASLTFSAGGARSQQIVLARGSDDVASGDLQVQVLVTVDRSSPFEWLRFPAYLESTLSLTFDDEDYEGSRYAFLTTPTSDNTVFFESGNLSSSWSVVLTRPPDGAQQVVVSAAVDTASAAHVLVSPSALTFNAGNWNAPQVVEASRTGLDPDVSTNLRFSIGDGSQSQWVATDHEESVPILSYRRGDLVFERADGLDDFVYPILYIGTDEVFGVRLDKQPSATVVISVGLAVFQPEIVMEVSPAMLTFSRDNWSESQQVTVSLSSYDDPAEPLELDFFEVEFGDVPGQNQAYEYDGYVNFDILGDLVLVDRDFGTVEDFGIQPDITEGVNQTISIYAIGSTSPVTFSLSSEGSSDVVQALTPTVVLDSDNETGSFVVVVPEDDYVNEIPYENRVLGNRNLPYTLQLTISSDDSFFNGAITQRRGYLDNDDPSFSIGSDATSIAEGGSVTLAVFLHSGLHPGSDDLVLSTTIFFDTPDSYVFTPATLTFSAGGSRTKQVVLSRVDDGFFTGDIQVAPAFVVVPPSPYEWSQDPEFTSSALFLTFEDDEDESELYSLLVSPADDGPVAVDEGGPAATWSVALSRPPDGNQRVVVTMTVNFRPGAFFAVTPNVVTFTANNWDTPRNVQVSRSLLSEVTPDVSTELRFWVASGSQPEWLAANPRQSRRIVSADQLASRVLIDWDQGVAVSGETLDVGVRLNKRPEGTVVISAYIDTSSYGTGGLGSLTNIRVSPGLLTLHQGNWSDVPVDVIIPSYSDDQAYLNEFGLRVTVVNAGDTVPRVHFSDYDNTFVGLSTVEVFEVVPEDGVYVGPTAPDGPVMEGRVLTQFISYVSRGNVGATVEVSDIPPGLVVHNPTLGFGTVNTTLAMSMTYQDDVLQGPAGTVFDIQVGLDVRSDDPVISARHSDVLFFQPRFVDDETAGYTIVPGPASFVGLLEGTTRTLNVALDARPPDGEQVVLDVDVSSVDGLDVSPLELTFTDATWNIPQQVVLTGVDDSFRAEDRVQVLSFSVAPGSSMPWVVADERVSMYFTVFEDDTAFAFAPSTLSLGVVPRGSTRQVPIVLPTAPSTGQVVIATETDTAVFGVEAAVTPAVLAFTGQNSHVQQVVTLSVAAPVSIDPAFSRPFTVTVRSVNSDIDDPMFRDITVLVVGTAVDRINVVGPDKVNEGSLAQITVGLHGARGADVTFELFADTGTHPVSVSVLEPIRTVPASESQTEFTFVYDDFDLGASADYPYGLRLVSSSGDARYVATIGLTGEFTDDDTPTFSVSPASLPGMVEGAFSRLGVELDSQPAQGQSVIVTAGFVGDGSRFALSPSSLTFDHRDWSVPQEITLVRINDHVAQGPFTGQVAFGIGAGSQQSFADSDHEVTVELAGVDDDVAGMLLANGADQVAFIRGIENVVPVRLRTAPSGTVVVSVTTDLSGVGAPFAVFPSLLTYTTLDWGFDQDVTVSLGTPASASADFGLSVEMSVLVVEDATADDSYHGRAGDITQVISDFGIAPRSVTPVEEGTTAMVTIRVVGDRTGPINFAVSRKTDVHDLEVTISPTSRTVAPNENEFVISVTYGNDTALGSYGTVLNYELRLATTSGDPSFVTTLDVVGRFTENDAPSFWVPGPTSGRVNEGNSRTFDVVLTARPDPGQRVLIEAGLTDRDGAPYGSQPYSILPGLLVFDEDNWDVVQQMTVFHQEDNVYRPEGALIASVVFSVAPGSQDLWLAEGREFDYRITASDNDSVELVVAGGQAQLGKILRGRVTEVPVRLATEPADVVVVTVSHSDTSAIEADVNVAITPQLLTFDVGNWYQSQYIRVSIARPSSTYKFTSDIQHDLALTIAVSEGDTRDAGYHGLTVSVSAEVGDFGIVSYPPAVFMEGSNNVYATVTVIGNPTRDDESVNPYLVVQGEMHNGDDSPTNVTLHSNIGDTGSDVVFNVYPNTDISSLVPTRIRMTYDDGVVNAGGAAPYELLVESSFDGLETSHVINGFIQDDESATFDVTPGDSQTTTLTEGEIFIWAPRLTDRPQQGTRVIIQATVVDMGDRFSSSRVTLNSLNYNSFSEVVVVSLVDDDLPMGDFEDATVRFFVAPGSEQVWVDEGHTVERMVSGVDNDSPPVVVGPPGVLPRGTVKRVPVSLGSEPDGVVELRVTHSDLSALGVDASVTPTVLTLNSVNWRVGMFLTISLDAPDAADPDFGQDLLLTVAAINANTDDPSFHGQSADVQGRVVDTGFFVDGPDPVTEGESAELTIMLSSAATRDVTVSLLEIIDNHNLGLQITPNMLTLSPGDEETVAYTYDDTIANLGGVSRYELLLETTSGEAHMMVTLSLSGEFQSDELASFNVSPSQEILSFVEGGSATLSVSLNISPVQGQVVHIAAEVGPVDGQASRAGQYSISPPTVTFTADDWDAPKQVVVSLADDDVAPGAGVDELEFTVGPGSQDTWLLVGTSHARTLMSAEDDTVAIVTRDSLGPITRGGSTRIPVRLGTRPTGEVVVRVTHTDIGGGSGVGVAAEVTPLLLTFGSDNWDIDQYTWVVLADPGFPDPTLRFDFQMTLRVATGMTEDGDYHGIENTTAGVIGDLGVLPLPLETTPDENTVDEGTDAMVTVVVFGVPAEPVTVAVVPKTDRFTLPVSITPREVVFSPGDSERTIRVTYDDDSVSDQELARYELSFTSTSGDADFVSDRVFEGAFREDDPATFTVAPGEGVRTLDEGQAEGLSYEVSLDSQPGADQTIHIVPTVRDTMSLFAVSPATLEFNSENGEDPQQVILSRIDDDLFIGSYEDALVFEVGGDSPLGWKSGVPHTQTREVEGDDDDIVGIQIGTGIDDLGTIQRNAETRIPVRLTSQPANGEVVLTVSHTELADVGVEAEVSPLTLTFNTGNWDSPQDVTVSLGDPGTPDASFDFAFTLSLSADDDDTEDGNYDGEFESAQGSIRDIGVAAADPAEVTEGESVTVPVRVVGDPGTQVNVAVRAVTDTYPLVASFTPQQFTFDTANSSMDLVLSIADDDFVSADNARRYQVELVSTSGNANFVTTLTLSGVFRDDEEPTYTVTPSGAVELDEGASQTYQVALDARPDPGAGNQVVVTAAVAGQPGLFTVTPASLTFDSDNWDSPQAVVLTRTDDEVYRANYSDELEFTVGASSPSHWVSHAHTETRSASGDDDDIVGIVMDELGTIRRGGITQVSVALTSEPTGNVVLAVTHTDLSTVGVARSVTPSELTFTSENWDSPQAVRVSLAEPGLLSRDFDFAFTLSVSSVNGETDDNFYDNRSASSEGEIVDLGIIAANPATVVEGSPATVTVTLVGAPEAGVDVDVSTNSGTGLIPVAVSPSRLEFDPGVETELEIVVSYDDRLVAAGDSSNYQLRLSSSGDASFATVLLLDGVYTDNDDPTYSVSPGGAVDLDEGATQVYAVTLASQPDPGQMVRINAVVQATAARFTVSPDSLTFTNANWDRPQQVRLTRDDDDVFRGPYADSLEFSVGGGSQSQWATEGHTESRAVSGSENDSAGIRIGSGNGNLGVVQRDGVTDIPVALTSEPLSGDVVLVVSHTDLSDVGVDSEVSPLRLTFNTGNWDTPQDVAVSLADPGTPEPSFDFAFTLSLSTDDDDTDDGFYDPVFESAEGSIRDIGLAAVDPAEVTEGQTATVPVRVVGDPGTQVNVAVRAVTDNYPLVASFSPQQFTFDTANSSMDLLLSIPDDDFVSPDSARRYEVELVSTSSNANFETTLTLGGVFRDDEVATFTVTPDAGADLDEGVSQTYMVALDARPDVGAANRVVVTTAVAGTNPELFSVTPGSLTFGSGNWDRPQAVVLTRIDDEVFRDSYTENLLFSIGASSPAHWVNLAHSETRAVSGDDNDTVGINMDDLGTIRRGSITQVSVSLTSEPTGDVVLAVTHTDLSTVGVDFDVSPPMLTFTGANWDSPQVVRVSLAEPALLSREFDLTFTLSLSAVNGQTDDNFYDNRSASSEGEIVDLGIIAANPATAMEGTATTVTVTLVGMSGSRVDVDVSANTGAGLISVSLNPTRLSFAPNVETELEISVSYDDRLVAAGDSSDYEIRLSSSGDPNFATVLVLQGVYTDDDDPTFSVSPGGAVDLDEGGTQAYAVTLDSQPDPGQMVRINAVVEGSVEHFTVSPDALTFTNANWDRPQQVRLTRIDDDVFRGDYGDGLRFTVASGSQSQWVSEAHTASRAVSGSDNDTVGTRIGSGNENLGVIQRNGVTDIPVALTSEPLTGDVVLTVSHTDLSGVGVAFEVSPLTLTFTTGNWDTSQDVTVSLADPGTPDAGFNFAFTLSLSVDDDNTDDGNYDGQDESAVGSIRDIGLAAVNPAEAPEGDTVTVPVRVVGDPGQQVNVAVRAVTDTYPLVVSFTPRQFTFDTANSSMDLMLSIPDDDFVSADSARRYEVALESTSGNPDFVTTLTLSGVFNDDEVATFSVSPADDVVLTEGVAQAYMVSLDARPDVGAGNEVVVTTEVTDDPGRFTASPASLTFDSNNWNSPQAVLLTRTDDEVFRGSYTDSLEFSVGSSSPSHWVGLGHIETRSVSGADDDMVGIVMGEFGTVRRGSVTQVSVELTSEPTGDVMLAVTHTDLSGVGVVYDVSPSMLSFTSSTWDTPQAVSVSLAEPNLLSRDFDFAFTLNVSAVEATTDDDLYDGQSQSTDGEIVDMGVIAANPATAIEGVPTTLTVTLVGMPGSRVDVDVSSNTGANLIPVSIDPQRLSFSPGVETEMEITIRYDDRLVADGGSSDYGLRLSSSGDPNFATVLMLSGVLTDNDEPTFSVSPSGSADLDEGMTQAYAVALDAQPDPGQMVRVDASVPGESERFTVSPEFLTFGNGNWDTPQQVRLTRIDDDVFRGDYNDNIGFTVGTGSQSQWETEDHNESRAVSGSDNDEVGIRIGSGSRNLGVIQRNGITEIPVELTSEPLTGEVVLEVSHTDLSTVGVDEMVYPSRLMFTAANWDKEQIVTVSLGDPGTPDPSFNFAFTLGLNSDDADTDDAFYHGQASTVTASIRDIGVAAADPIIATEGAATTVTVRVVGDPGTQVTVDVRAKTDVHPLPVSFAPSRLEFRPGVDSQLEITVSHDDDFVAQSATSGYELELESSSGNPDFVTTLVLAGEFMDDDEPTFSVDIGDAVVLDEGRSQTYRVSLDARPDAGQMVVIDVAILGAPDQFTLDRSMLTFDTDNWDSPQAVVLTRNDDDVFSDSYTDNLQFTVGEGSQAQWLNRGQNEARGLSGDDDDTVGVAVSELGVLVRGGVKQVDVRLLSEPSMGEVVLTVSHSDLSGIDGMSATPVEYEISPQLLIFGTGPNWAAVSAVMVSIGEPSDRDPDFSLGLTLTVRSVNADTDDSNYDDLTVTVAGRISDLGISISLPTIMEGGVAQDATIRLIQEPSARVVVSLSTQEGEFMVETRSLTFTPANWDAPQQARLRAVDDPDVDGQTQTALDVSFAGEAEEYRDVTQSFQVTVQDDDMSGVVALWRGNPDALSVPIGRGVPFEVVLGSRPLDGSVVVVTLSQPGVFSVTSTVTPPVTAALTSMLSAATLTFTRADWDTPRLVTMSVSMPEPEIQDVGHAVEVSIGTSSETTDSEYRNTLPTATVAMSVVSSQFNDEEIAASRVVVGVSNLAAAFVASDAVAGRVGADATPSSDGPQLNLSGVGGSSAHDGPSDPWVEDENAWRGDFSSIVHGSDFTLPLVGQRASRARLEFWGSVKHYDQSGNPEVSLTDDPEADKMRVEYDGETTGYVIGFGRHFEGGNGLGIALASTSSEFDLGGGLNVTRFEREILSVHPYFGLALGDNVGVWVTGGYGKGEARFEVGDRIAEADVEALMYGAGLSAKWRLSVIDMAFRASGSGSRTEIDNEQVLETESLSLTSDAWKGEVEFEAGKRFDSVDGSSFVHPYLLAAYRGVGGDIGESGAYEAGGGFRAKSADSLSLEFEGRFQVEDTEHNQNTLQGNLRFDRHFDDRGLYLLLNSNGSVDRSDANGDLMLRGDYDAKVGYGWGWTVLGRHGVLGLSVGYDGDGQTETKFGFIAKGLNFGVAEKGTEQRLYVDLISYDR